MVVPMVVQQDGRAERSFDIFSRLLHERIVFLGRPIDDDVANVVNAQLLHLDAEDPEAPIQLFINSPGGVVYAGLAMVDTMQFVRAPVHTVCCGIAMSAAAIVLAAGEPGHRMTLPNGRILIHQPSGGFQGQATDIAIHAEEALHLRDRLDELLAGWTGQTKERIRADSERDRFFSAEEAREYGIVDRVVARSPARG